MFKVGDEVEAIHLKKLGSAFDESISFLALNTPYTVTGFTMIGDVLLAEVKSFHPLGCWNPTRFRKVQRKNSRLTLEAFFTVPGGFEEPKRAPAKKKTDA